MINNKKVLVLIPARGGSKGLPRKNIMKLCGKPLLGWPILAAKESICVDKIVVSTDDQEIADIALMEGAEVPFLRPAELASDVSLRNAVIEHALIFLHDNGETFDYLIFLEPTSPLTESQDIDSALKLLDKNRQIADAIVGVSMTESSHPDFVTTVDKKGLIEPYIGNKFKFHRRQDTKAAYFFEGSLYISDVNAFWKNKEFYHDRTMAFVFPKWKSFEVDDITDFICIEAIMKNKKRIKGELQ